MPLDEPIPARCRFPVAFAGKAQGYYACGRTLPCRAHAPGYYVVEVLLNLVRTIHPTVGGCEDPPCRDTKALLSEFGVEL